MDFGMPTLLEIESLSDTVDLCHALGLQFVELNMNLPQYRVGDISADLLARYQEAFYFTIHLEEKINPWDFNPFVSRAYLDTVTSIITVAKEAKIPILNMHMNSGIRFTMPDRKAYLFERFQEEYLQRTIQFRKTCEAAAEDGDFLIAIENCDGFTGFQTEAIEILLESPLFGLTFDIGHNHTAKKVDEPFLMEHKERIRHMHIHDAVGAKNHLAIGTGEIQVREKLTLAKELGCRCVLETKTVEGLRESVLNLRGILDSAGI